MTDRERAAPDPSFSEEGQRVIDPNRRHRLIIGVSAAFLMALSVIFTGTVYGFETGEHSGIFKTTYGTPEFLIVAIALASSWGVLKPLKPDPRVGQALCLAAGMVSLAYGVVLFFGALLYEPTGSVVEAHPGGQAWLLIVAGVLFMYLRWNRSVWPESPWELNIRNAVERRARR
jgi:hypothetical protein